MAVMGVASITPAFPTIIDQFRLSPADIGLLITAFTVPGIILTPFMGILADRFSRKTILIPSLILFGLAGSSCAFAHSYHQLLVFRMFQGMGAASLGSLNITLIGDFYTGNKRAAVMGYNASVLSIGVALYPALGGILTMMNWRFVFLFPILSLPVAFLVWRYLNTPVESKRAKIRLYFQNVWKTINRKKVWGLFFINILVFIILYGAYLTFFPILLKQDYQATPLIIGLLMSFMSLTTALTSSQMGRFSRKLKKRQLLMVGTLAYAVSLLLLAGLSGWSFLVPAVLIFGIAHGLMIPTMQTLLVGLASVNERAAFMSINSMVLRIGQSLGPVLIGLFYFNRSLTGVFLAGAGCTVLILLIIIFKLKTKFDD